MIIKSDRMILRPFKDADLRPYTAMGQDPETMRYFSGLMTPSDSKLKLDGFRQRLREDGFHFLAATDAGNGAFLGVLGIARIDEATRKLIKGQPAVEIGWSLQRSSCGRGLATEGARACLTYAWEQLDLDEVVALTTVENLPSRRVMEKIGMSHDTEANFDMAATVAGRSPRPSVVYRIKNSRRTAPAS